MRSAGLELLLPASLDGPAVSRLLARRLEVEIGRPQTLDRVLLDTFDGPIPRAQDEVPAERSQRGLQRLQRPAGHEVPNPTTSERNKQL